MSAWTVKEGSEDSFEIFLVTPEQFPKFPDGFEFFSISGERAIKGKDYIDNDTRFGKLAYGIKLPIDSELHVKLKLLGAL